MILIICLILHSNTQMFKLFHFYSHIPSFAAFIENRITELEKAYAAPYNASAYSIVALVVKTLQPHRHSSCLSFSTKTSSLKNLGSFPLAAFLS